MSELTSRTLAQPPYPTFSEKLKFYGIGVAVALLLVGCCRRFFGSGRRR
jgi:hypothetical protein